MAGASRADEVRTRADWCCRCPAPGGSSAFRGAGIAVMEPALASNHPDIKTYAWPRHRQPGEPRAVHHAPRLPRFGAWPAGGAGTSIPPRLSTRPSTRATSGTSVTENPHRCLVERSGEEARFSADRGFYHAPDTVTVRGAGFASTRPSSSPSQPARSRPRPVPCRRGGGRRSAPSRSTVADPDSHPRLPDRGHGYRASRRAPTTSSATKTLPVDRPSAISSHLPAGPADRSLLRELLRRRRTSPRPRSR